MRSSESGERHPAPYAPIPPGARLTFAWAAPLVGLAIYGAANVLALPVLAPFAIAAAMGAGGDAMITGMMAALAVVSFGAFGGLAIWWARLFERRGPATIGFRRGFGRYGFGLLFGLAIAALLLSLSALVSAEEMGPVLAGLRRLNSPDGLLLLAALFAILVLQSGAEETVFRGWMLSAVTARRGPIMGVAISSIGFAILHAHYLFYAPLTGLMVLASVGVMGAVFAFYALAERSIWGPCAAHAAYNFIIMAMTLAQALGSDPEVTPVEVVLEVLTQVTSVLEYDSSIPAGLVLMSVLAVATWAVWRRSADRPDAVTLADQER